VVTETLSESGEKIKRDNNECSVRLVVVVGIGFKCLVLRKTGLNDLQTSLVDRLRVRCERLSGCNGYG